MKWTILFRALNVSAMIGITRMLIASMQRLWQQKRQKQIEVSEQLIEQIGRHAAGPGVQVVRADRVVGGGD